MNTFTEKLKKKALENIVFIVIVIIGLIYLLASGEVLYAKVAVSLLILMYPCGISTYILMKVMVDWRLLRIHKKFMFVWFSVALSGSVLLLYMGWKEEVYVIVPVSAAIGLVMFIVEKIFSIGRR